MDKLLVLEAGRVKQFGPARELMQAMQGGRVVPMPHPGGQVVTVGGAA